MSQVLKPCPFCGSTNLTVTEVSSYVMCRVCDADGPIIRSAGSAIAAWNTRHIPVPTAGDLPERMDAPSRDEYGLECYRAAAMEQAKAHNDCLDACLPIITRLQAENAALQQRLNTADQRVDELQSESFEALYNAAIEERDALKAEVERIQIALRREEQEHGETVNQRDQAEGYADSLAGSIGEYFRVEIGEHSSMNSPWVEAEKVLNGDYKTDSDVERERDALQFELIKARELLSRVERVLYEKGIWGTAQEIESYLAQQSAPAAKGEGDE